MNEDVSVVEQAPLPQPEAGHRFLRRMFFIACLLFFTAILLYLLYHNGKSIYDNGI